MTVTTIPEADWPGLQSEALLLLKNLIQVHTINPSDLQSGMPAVGETVADQLLQRKLQLENISSEILFKQGEPTRGNLIARLQGDGSRQPVLLLGHLDVAGVVPSGWTPGIDPFGGEIKDGRLYGRGAADMKDLVVMHAMTMLIAKRYGIKLKRDLILAGVADEEGGSHAGVIWLIEQHWDKIAAEFSFNEGFSGGPVVGHDGKTVIWVGLEAVEKRILIAEIKALGHPGHASSEQPDNAIYRLAEALQQLQKHPRPIVLSPLTERFVLTIKACFGKDPRESDVPDVRAIFRDTVVPTLLSGGTEVIVLPAEASASLNCRLLPTTEANEFVAWLEAVVSLPGIQVSYPYGLPGSSSPASPAQNELVTAYIDGIRRHLGTHLPVILTQGIATTDSARLRQKGVAAYGVRPLLDTQAENMHGNNESISVDGFKLGLRMFFEIVMDLAT